MTWALVLSCEHATRAVPEEYRDLFAGADGVLATHRGYDIGAAAVASRLAATLDAPLFQARATRLLCDCNRSSHHPKVLSEYTRGLPAADRAALLARYYHPYRDEVTEAIEERVAAGASVLHVSVHSFTPVLDGARRDADVGLLYDPGRSWERDMARAWGEALARATGLRVRRNYPYRGTADGFTTHLRKRFADGAYAGIEVECNQALSGDEDRASWLAEMLGETLPES